MSSSNGNRQMGSRAVPCPHEKPWDDSPVRLYPQKLHCTSHSLTAQKLHRAPQPSASSVLCILLRRRDTPSVKIANVHDEVCSVSLVLWNRWNNGRSLHTTALHGLMNRSDGASLIVQRQRIQRRREFQTCYHLSWNCSDTKSCVQSR